MTTLVTGASGFIGLNLLETLLSKGETVVAFSHDALPSAARPLLELPGTLHYVQGDISRAEDIQGLFASHRIRHVVHAAAITAGANTPPRDVERVLRVNVAGTQLLLEASLKAGVERFLLTSSSAVHGNAPFDADPVNEEAATQPAGLYGYTKVLTEQLANIAHEQHGLDVRIARLTAIFGPWERDTGVRSTLSPPFQLALAALQGRPVRIARGGRRDWTLSTDIARGLDTLLRAPAPRHRVYNLASGQLWHVSVMCEALSEHFPEWRWTEAEEGQEPDIQYNDDLTRPRISPMLGERFSSEFGQPFTPAEVAAREYAEWVVRHTGVLLN